MVSQSCINWNRDVLKRELGLEEEDIIDLPILFKLVAGTKHQDAHRALAYYPDMVDIFNDDLFISNGISELNVAVMVYCMF